MYKVSELSTTERQNWWQQKWYKGHCSTRVLTGAGLICEWANFIWNWRADKCYQNIIVMVDQLQKYAHVMPTTYLPPLWKSAFHSLLTIWCARKRSKSATARAERAPPRFTFSYTHARRFSETKQRVCEQANVKSFSFVGRKPHVFEVEFNILSACFFFFFCLFVCCCCFLFFHVCKHSSS